MDLLFVNGDRGLKAQKDGKFYFPDRHGTITTEGLYSCTITKEFDKYSFVTGELIETVLPPVEYVISMINDNFTSRRYEYIPNKVMEFTVGKVGESIILRGTYINRDTLCYFNKNLEMLYIRSDYIASRHDIYNNTVFDTCQEYTDLLCKVINQISCKIDSEDYYKISIMAILRKYPEYFDGYIKDLQSVQIIDDRYIQISRNILRVGIDTTLYVYTADHDLCNLTKLYGNDNMKFSNGLERKSISVKEIMDYMIDNHIGCPITYDKDNPVCYTNINFLGERITVAFLNVFYLLNKITDEDKCIVEQSWEKIRCI